MVGSKMTVPVRGVATRQELLGTNLGRACQRIVKSGVAGVRRGFVTCTARKRAVGVWRDGAGYPTVEGDSLEGLCNASEAGLAFHGWLRGLPSASSSKVAM